jgi:hypothetical protein
MGLGATLMPNIDDVRPNPEAGYHAALCYSIVLPGRKAVFRAGFRPDSIRESHKIGPPAGLKADVEAFPIRIWSQCGPEARFPDRKHYCLT